MTIRRRLADRRYNQTLELEAGGLCYTATFSKFADGSLGELFLNNHKSNSTAGIMASDSAIAASLALQFGCPPETLRRALSRDGQGHATGILGVALDAILISSGA